MRVSIARLEQFCAELFEVVGVKPDHAYTTAKRLVEADTRGRTGHGLIRVGPYIQRIEAGGINLDPTIQVIHETPTSAQLDGDNGLGQVIMSQATEIAITKAKVSGMAWVGTVHSNHAGAAGIYPLMAANEGLIAIYVAVANANGMPPWGGSERLLGTNPISIAVPTGDGSPFVLDIATTVASHGSIKVAAQAGEELPVGWVVDAEGRPITDPGLVHDGYLMPIGGYKGSGLNIAIGLLGGVMNGAAFGGSVVNHLFDLAKPTNTGQAIFVMRADLFMPADQMYRSVAEHLDELRSSASASGETIRMPGDTAARVEAQCQEFGVSVPARLLQDLNQLAERLGVASLG